jgi:hypothetical protein
LILDILDIDREQTQNEEETIRAHSKILEDQMHTKEVQLCSHPHVNDLIHEATHMMQGSFTANSFPSNSFSLSSSSSHLIGFFTA